MAYVPGLTCLGSYDQVNLENHGFDWKVVLKDSSKKPKLRHFCLWKRMLIMLRLLPKCEFLKIKLASHNPVKSNFFLLVQQFRQPLFFKGRKYKTSRLADKAMSASQTSLGTCCS